MKDTFDTCEQCHKKMHSASVVYLKGGSKILCKHCRKELGIEFAFCYNCKGWHLVENTRVVGERRVCNTHYIDAENQQLWNDMSDMYAHIRK